MILSTRRGETLAASADGDPPALFTSTSRRPNRFEASCTSALACSGTRTSAVMNRADRPSTVGSSSGSLRPQISTSAPAARNASVMPRPMPRVPPVTTIARPPKSSGERSPDTVTGSPYESCSMIVTFTWPPPSHIT